MAIYNYVCLNDECETEDFQKMRPMSESNEPASCPQCESECHRAHNDFCKASPVLLGTGWARDGYQIMKPVGNVLKRSDSAK